MIKIFVSNARLWPGYVETLPKRRCRGALNFLTKKSLDSINFKKMRLCWDCCRLKDWTQVDLFSSISCKEKNDTVSDLVFYEGKSRELKIVNKDNISYP